LALPLLGMQLAEPPIPRRPYEPLEFQGGKALVFQNDGEHNYVSRAHGRRYYPPLLLAVLCLAAGPGNRSAWAPLIALGLIAFDPHADGHPRWLLDAGNAFFMFLAIYAF